MIDLTSFIPDFYEVFNVDEVKPPWEIVFILPNLIRKKIETLDKNQFIIKGDTAIHKSATIEKGVSFKGPIIIGRDSFIGANAYLRNGVYIGDASSVGPCCEIKASIIFNQTNLAHFNFIGDSLLGNNVNFEAGAIIANHYNERTAKEISVLYQSNIIKTNTIKFGALIGDDCKIGANAVLSPGTLLYPDSIVKRLELVEQLI